MERPSDETLVSYVDGVATPDERARVERAMRQDPAIRDRVDAMRRSAALLAEAFDRPMREAPPQHLVDMIMSAPVSAADEAGAANENAAQSQGGVVQARPRPSRPRHSSSRSSPVMALAASIAVLLAAGVGFLAGTTIRSAPPPTGVALGTVPPGGNLASLLESKPSGSSTAAAVSDDGRSYTVVNTFLDRNRRPCREIELLAPPSADSRPLAAAVACRRPSGSWTVEGAVTLAQTTATDASGYEPSGAGEEDALTALLNTLGASTALSAAEEAELIGADWRR